MQGVGCRNLGIGFPQLVGCTVGTCARTACPDTGWPTLVEILFFVQSQPGSWWHLDVGAIAFAGAWNYNNLDILSMP